MNGRALVVTAALLLAPGCTEEKKPDPGTKDAKPATKEETRSREAFVAAFPVFLHPRCMNCHPSGDIPLQGEDSHLHAQNVQRGTDGRGKYALKCASCHQETNLSGANMPPGNPKWKLPPADMPMVFQGQTPAGLARQLTDPKKNGGKTIAEILHHVTEDSLVLGAWEPGEGRAPPPMPHAEFAKLMREWVDKGAAIPDR